MFDNYLKEVIQFNNLNKENKAAFICTKLKEDGFDPQIQTFISCFGEGKNIFAEIGNSNLQNKIIISAHYDGKSLFDNTGGVIALLNVSEIISNHKLPFSFIFLFTDQEETYQQGAAYFLQSHVPTDISKNINIDGFGLGAEVYSVSELTHNTYKNSDLYLCDSDEFVKHGISSISYFSAFECDFMNAKNNGNIYLTFEKYKTESFFKNKYDNQNIQILINKLCKILEN